MSGLRRKHWSLLLASLLLGAPLGCQSDFTPSSGNQQASSSPVGGNTSQDPSEGGSTADSESSGGSTGVGQGGIKATSVSAESTGGIASLTGATSQGGAQRTGTQQATTQTETGGTGTRGGSASGGRSSSRLPSTTAPAGGRSQGGAASSSTSQPGKSTGGMGGTGGTATARPTSTSTTMPSTAAQEYVDAHNAVRAAVTAPSNYSGTWVPLPNVTWSEQVAASAQQWANHLRDELNCGLQHEGSGTGYGENLAAGTNLTPARAVEMWASEKSLFTYTKPFSYTASAGHYTQIVWRTSVEIGCASATCNRSVVISCRYKPPGNVIGGQIF
jgi:pathogenesis-related protein 1